MRSALLDDELVMTLLGAVKVVPSNVKLAEPANEPLELYWTWVVDPPGVVGVVAAFDANNFTVPAAFLKYSFSSVVLSANSPATKLPAEGVAEAVVL
jgi:hypothetical protein